MAFLRTILASSVSSFALCFIFCLFVCFNRLSVCHHLVAILSLSENWVWVKLVPRVFSVYNMAYEKTLGKRLGQNSSLVSHSAI